MTFKVTVVNKFSENVLHKGRNGVGVKAELFFIRFDKMFGKHHVSDTKRGRDRFVKRVTKIGSPRSEPAEGHGTTIF